MAKDCLRDPIPEIFEAARFLQEAVTAHISGNFVQASAAIAKADMPPIREWTESLWGARGPWTRPFPVKNPLPFLPKAARALMRMPNDSEKMSVLARDGRHCRFCGIPVARAEVRLTLHRVYPESLPWGSRNIDQHAGFQAIWLQYDHVVPHARGGNNDLNNLIVACAPCNNGRSNLTLEEAELSDPFLRRPISSQWDGLERILRSGALQDVSPNANVVQERRGSGTGASAPVLEDNHQSVGRASSRSLESDYTAPQNEKLPKPNEQSSLRADEFQREVLSPEEYMMPDNRTHKYWWTWIPARPLTHEDKWYRILQRVFADHTTNFYKNNAGSGFYTESLKGDNRIKLENHQTVGVFHTFSAFQDLNWAHLLCGPLGIDLQPPISEIAWQYQLQGPDAGGVYRDLHADIALRIVDAAGPADPCVVIVEAKRRGGELKARDLDGSYTRLSQINSVKRKHFALLIDESDVAKVPSTTPVATWQLLARIQLDAISKIATPKVVLSHLLSLFSFHLSWFGIVQGPKSLSAFDQMDEPQLYGIAPRERALVRGLETVANARLRRPVQVPAEFPSELSIEDYTALSQKGAPVLSGTQVWQELMW